MDIAEMARTNLLSWGLESQVKVETGDIREKASDEPFDIATLNNNIYYFPVEGRVNLLQRIASFLRPGGFLLLTTCCQGGSLGAEALNLGARPLAALGDCRPKTKWFASYARPGTKL